MTPDASNAYRPIGMDILDGTPLLDVKPYTAKFDCIHGTRNGWQDGIDAATAQVRGRRDFPRNAQT